MKWPSIFHPVYIQQGNWHSGVGILEDDIFEKQILPEGSPVAEKRKFARVSITLPVRFRAKAKNPWVIQKTLDLSNNGVRITSPDEIPIKTILELEILFPGGNEFIKMEGKVVWVKRSSPVVGQRPYLFECGVSFVNLRKHAHKRKLTYLLADRICSVIANRIPDGLTMRPVQTKEEMQEVFKLLYKSYLKKGYCKKNPYNFHYSPYTFLPETRALAIYRNNKLLGTISLIPDSPCGLPVEVLFPREIDSIRRLKGRKMAEIGLLAMDSEAFRGKSFSLSDFFKLQCTFWLFKIMHEYARNVAGITDLIIAVHPKHSDLYEYLAFKSIANWRPYPSARGNPALPMRQDTKEIFTSHINKPVGKFFLTTNKFEKEILTNYLQWDTKTLKKLLQEETSIEKELPEVFKTQLASSYPGLVFDLKK